LGLFDRSSGSYRLGGLSLISILVEMIKEPVTYLNLFKEDL